MNARRIRLNDEHHPDDIQIQGPREGERAVLVTTAHRGVFFGYTTDATGAIVALRRGRNCIYWPPENRGFVGLASLGPLQGSKVGPPADMELRDITAVVAVTRQAIDLWEAGPWT